MKPRLYIGSSGAWFCDWPTGERGAGPTAEAAFALTQWLATDIHWVRRRGVETNPR